MQPGDVILGAAVGDGQRARLRVLTGADELALFGCDYAAALAWADERLVAGDDAVPPGDLLLLAIGDADRLFASLYRALFGELVELRQRCQACPESFEMALCLSDLVPPPQPFVSEALLPGGTRLRAPRIGDLIAAGEGADLVTLVTLAEGDDDADARAAGVAALAPATVETIETACPHCSATQAILFDLPCFFLRCAERERDLLLREVHLLARTYGWGLAEILSLRRSERHALVRMATAALAPRNRVQLA